MMTDIYLIPLQETIDPEKYATDVKKVLTEMGVISGEYAYDDLDWYSAGDDANQLFGSKNSFETCEIYGKPDLELVPSSPSPEPKCPRCGHNVSEQYYDAVNDYEELAPKPGYQTTRVTCPKCNTPSRLNELKNDPPIYLTRTFVRFDDTMDPLLPEWLTEFNRKLGIPHAAHEYSYT